MFALPLILSLFSVGVKAFNNDCNDNLVAYWGSNSWVGGGGNPAQGQQTLSYYCQDNSIDVIPIAFVNAFQGPGGLPVMDLSVTCNATSNPVFSGTGLINCNFLASDIEFCQSKGKIVTISLGGAGGGGTPSAALADTIWNLFLGGSSSTRPFGAAVLDGVDLDIEAGTASWAPFVNQLRSHFTGASKQYYVSAAPQCPYPDASLGSALNTAYFDMVYVQFYNNPCGLGTFSATSPTNWNFNVWDAWARTVSPNPNVKVYIGAPGGPTAAGSGYTPIAQLTTIIQTTRKSFPSFGGVMFWDASQIYQNNRLDVATKAALTSGGGCGNTFVFPPCKYPPFSASAMYPGGSQVSYEGYDWQAVYYASGPPVLANDLGAWRGMDACQGSGGGTTTSKMSTTTSRTTSTTGTTKISTTTSTVHTTTTTSKTTSTTSAASTAPAGGNCAGVAAWSTGVAYNGGAEVTYNGHLWQAKWWSESDAPGGPAGDWTDLGACTSSKRSVVQRAPEAGINPVQRRNLRFARDQI